MMGTSALDQSKADGLRERNKPMETNDADIAKQAVLQLNAAEEAADKADSEKKTYGRTPGGVG